MNLVKDKPPGSPYKPQAAAVAMSSSFSSSWHAMQALLQAEVRKIFSSVLSYIFLALLVFFYALLYFIYVFIGGRYQLQPITENIGLLLFFLTPLMSATMIAKERRSGSLIMLFLSPLSSLQVVAMKYLAALFLISLALASTLLIPLGMELFSFVQDWAAVFTALLGLWLLSMASLSLGLFLSALSSSETSASLLSIFACLFIIILRSAVNSFPPLLAKWVDFIVFYQHLFPFARSFFSPSDILYFLVFTATFLCLAAFFTDTLRWRR